MKRTENRTGKEEEVCRQENLIGLEAELQLVLALTL